MPSASVPPPTADALPRQFVRDPDFWLNFVAAAVIAFSAVQILLFSFGRDQGIYALIGEGILGGKMPYRDLWDFKPPGIHLAYALSQAIFGRTMTAPRLLEVGGLLITVWGFLRLSETFFGIARVGLIGAALAALIHAELEFWHTGQPEAFGGFLTVGALVLTVSEPKRRFRWVTWAGVGFLFGCAFLFKPPLGGGALVCVAYLIRREQTADRGKLAAAWPALVAGIGSAVPIAACALWFRLGGAWDELSWTMFEFTPGYTTLSWEDRSAPEMFYVALEEAFFRFSALAAAGVIAAIVIPPLHRREREGLFLVLGIMSVHVAGIAMQGKFFAYHYSATLPLIAFIAGLGLYKLWRRCLMGGAGGVLAFASFLVVATAMRTAVQDLPGSFWWRSQMRLEYLLGTAGFRSREVLDRELYYVSDYSLDADRRLAGELRRRTEPGEPVYIWGFEPIVYWLAERPPASRFIYDVPQRAAWERTLARRSLLQDLKDKPPRFIAVQRRDVFPSVTGSRSDSRQALESFDELRELMDRSYQFVVSVEDFDLYQRGSGPKIPANLATTLEKRNDDDGQ